MRPSERAAIVNRARIDREFLQECIQRYQADEPDYDRVLLEVYDRLLWRLTARYYRVELLSDVFQEMRLSLLSALKKYDPSRGLNPLTWSKRYMTWYVRRTLMDTCSVVRFPCHYYGKPGRSLFKRYVFNFSELPDKYNEDMKEPFEAQLRDDSPPVDELLKDEQLERTMPEVLLALREALHPTEWKVLVCRFFKGMTLEETGKSLKTECTASRARQVEQRALEKLRARAARKSADPFKYGTFEEWVGAAIPAFKKYDAYQESVQEVAGKIAAVLV